jgi:hypothetical protein
MLPEQTLISNQGKIERTNQRITTTALVEASAPYKRRLKIVAKEWNLEPTKVPDQTNIPLYLEIAAFEPIMNPLEMLNRYILESLELQAVARTFLLDGPK